ncbi:hypothetical protein Tco_0894156 [Tanacetum coccineum]|uniref:Uncharacterized protein n=1 Tax=Tanacetum coccineum TaxID=301880 RepID=A0ABQ5CH87_9ASTR
MYHDLCLGGKALAERENVGFDFTKSDLCHSFIKDLTLKGVGLRVVDSHTGNHREDDFTPLETIRRFLGIIESISLSSSKGRPSSWRGGYVIKPPVECKTIFLPLFTMSAKDAIHIQMCVLTKEQLSDFIELYPIPSEYRVMLPEHIQTIFDAPDGISKFIFLALTRLAVPSSLPFLSYAKRMDVNHRLNSSGVSSICFLVASGCFSFVQDSIVPVDCLKFILKDNRWDTKSFKDKLPPQIHDNPMFQRLGRYPANVRVFPGPILFFAFLKHLWEYGQQRPAIIVGGKEMAFKNFMYGDSPRQEKLVIHSESVATRIQDRQSRTKVSSKPPVKWRLVQAGSPFLTIFDDDEGLPNVLELQDANACHLKISNITPMEWRGHLDNQLDVEFLDLHDHCYARQAVMDNAVNRRAQELLKAKCEAVLVDFDNNPAMKVLYEKIDSLLIESKVASLEAEKAKLENTKASLHQEVENIRRDRAEVVLKVVPYVEMELGQSYDMGKLVAKLVSSAIFFGRCHAFEEVTNMKEPFDLTKVKGYRPSYKQKHTKAGNDFATATFPFLSDVVADLHASVKALLSKKPRILQRPTPTRTHVSVSFTPSQKATPSSAPVSKSLSPPSHVTSIATPVSKP